MRTVIFISIAILLDHFKVEAPLIGSIAFLYGCILATMQDYKELKR